MVIFQVPSLVLYIRLLYSVSPWPSLRSDWLSTLCSEVVFAFHQLADLVKVHILIHIKPHNLISVLPPFLPSRSLDHPAGCHQRLLADMQLAQRYPAEEKNPPLDFLAKTQYQCWRQQNVVLIQIQGTSGGGRFNLNCVHSTDYTFTRRPGHPDWMALKCAWSARSTELSGPSIGQPAPHPAA